MMKKIWRIVKSVLLALLVLFFIDFFCFFSAVPPPVSGFVLLFGFSPRYSKIMEIPVEANGKTVACGLYRRDGSPFLLVGPYPFLKDQSDFFFVAKDFVQVRFLDDKTDDWTRIFKWVWIMQDMDPNGWDSYAPCYSFNETRTPDPKTGIVAFTLADCEKNGSVHYRFSIPKHLIDALPEYRENRRKD